MIRTYTVIIKDNEISNGINSYSKDNIKIMDEGEYQDIAIKLAKEKLNNSDGKAIITFNLDVGIVEVDNGML
jgi:hypothetical protein